MKYEIIKGKENEIVAENIDSSNNMYLAILLGFGLPIENILAPVEERKAAFINLPYVIEKIPEKELGNAYYFSKFFVAVGNGLFDAALNYLWDETISQLRLRIVNSDLNYFYDLAISDQKRSDFSKPEDLVKLDDSSLIDGALKIGLISQIGFKHLDHIRYMRNWASAAHPNQNELTGLDLVHWMEICIKEVINLPPSDIVIKINQLLQNIKENIVENEQADLIISLFSELNQEKINSLIQGFFGIYINDETTQQTRTNINILAPSLWNYVTEEIKYSLGTRVATFIANSVQPSIEFGKQFLDIVSGNSYLPDAVKIPYIKQAIENLSNSHRTFQNFYNEPSYARSLKKTVGEHNIPMSLYYLYTKTLVDVFITNGNGVCWDANEIYKDLIRNFDSKQAFIAITSFTDEKIKSKLQFQLCRTKYEEMLDLLEPNLTNSIISDLLKTIKPEIRNLSTMNHDNKLIQRIQVLNKEILK